jgi:hypothetical protein
MKLATELRVVEKSSHVVEKAFSIKATAKAFAILSSGLYSDKILAIVRELSCNAYDAHVAAGKKDTPFEIKLPTTLDPTLYVKDYGVGLSHEEVLDLYTTYFDSSKTDSDDYIGALGLGSKSPFSYVQTFSVESRHNGVKRLYTAFIGETGVPSIAKLGEETTTESNGVTISLAGKSSDVENFRAATRKALMYFNPMPQISGGGVTAFALEHTVSGSNWKVRKADYYAHMRGAYVIQGQVAYPIEREVLSQNGMSVESYNVLGLDIDFTVPIGKVEVAASREALSYTKTTIKNLIEVVNVAAGEMRDVLQKQFDACQTRWDAQILHAQLREKGSMKTIFLDLNKTKEFTWENVVISEHVDANLNTVKATRLKLLKLAHHWKSNSIKFQQVSMWTSSSTPASLSFSVKPRLQVLVDDIHTSTTLYKQYMENYRAENKIVDSMYVLVLTGMTKKAYDQKEIDVILNLLGNPPAVYMSTLSLESSPASKTKGGYYKPRKADKALCWVGFSEKHARRQTQTFSRLCWSDASIDLHDTASVEHFYVEIKRFNIYDLDGTEATEFNRYLSACQSIGLIPLNVKVYGLNEKQVLLAQHNPKWTNVFKSAPNKFNEANKDDALLNRAAICETLVSIGRGVTTYIIAEWNTLRPQVADGAFKNTFDTISSLYEATKHIPHQPSAIKSAAFHIKDKTFSGRVEMKRIGLFALFQQMIEKHSMLRLVGWEGLKTKDVDMIIEYVNFIATK